MPIKVLNLIHECMGKTFEGAFELNRPYTENIKEIFEENKVKVGRL